ncbi:hypothetical protein ACKWTZ_002004 [Campylobacter jejuni]|uniref:hypothetical protein n=1 Tax=Campylobacter TaxID=194 RepID=UPI0012F7C383|nr:hypothetical protein [Campylobacter coli]EHY0484709.1 hypothetical protein [Campylobacter jejuni]EIF6269303.1 hypothetical protein [Campylobacter jejuni]EJO9334807.1 hypothetical protein [Campylobacter jejuni]EJP2887946.1 hypothetical protein [Campylobacter jejuni]ELQ2062482.1 hypothetical protein [Campylobacter jejuni]
MTTLELELIAEIERLQDKITEYQQAEMKLHEIIKSERIAYENALEAMRNKLNSLEQDFKDLKQKTQETEQLNEQELKQLETLYKQNIQNLENELETALKRQ